MFVYYSSIEIQEEVIRQSLDTERIEIRLSKNTGDFPFAYEVLIFGNAYPSMRDQVEKLKKISSLAMAETLCDDESINPYQYIYFRPGEEAVVVGVDAETLDNLNELRIDCFMRNACGIVGVENPLTEHHQHTMIGNMNPIRISALTLIDSVYMDLDFQKAQRVFHELSLFRYFYLLYPPEKSPWYSKEEKAVHLTTSLTQWSEEQQIKACFFPPNHDVVKNIPGGSDSEKFCKIIRNGREEKIIYKERRQSW